MSAEYGMRSAECETLNAAAASIHSALLTPDSALEMVRELSEHACTRPAPRVLHCIPWVPFRPAPVPALRVKLDARIHIALLLAEMGRALHIPQSELPTA